MVFRKYGPIQSVKLSNKGNKHYGYVMYENTESAKKAMIDTNNLNVFGKIVYVDFYENKKMRVNQKVKEQEMEGQKDF